MYSRDKNGGKILFYDSNNDSRFDKIELINIPKGDIMESFANLETANRIIAPLEDKKE